MIRKAEAIASDVWKRRRVTRWRRYQIDRQVLPSAERHIDSRDRRDRAGD